LAIRVRDVQRVAAFYRDVLQLEVVPAPRDGVAWFRAGELLVMIEPVAVDGVARDDNVEHPGLHLIAFAIEPHQRAHWEQRLQECGVPVVSRSAHTLYVCDPEGTRVGLSHYPDGVA
jgi:catechol-2,3-dioxygenase